MTRCGPCRPDPLWRSFGLSRAMTAAGKTRPLPAGTEEEATASFWAAPDRWEWEKSCLPWISCLVLEAAGFDPAWGGERLCFTAIGLPG